MSDNINIWLERIKNKSRKNYLHFDFPIGKKIGKRIIRDIANPNYVERHQFWPCIRFTQNIEKIKPLKLYIDKHNLPQEILSLPVDDLKIILKAHNEKINGENKFLISSRNVKHKYTSYKSREIMYASHKDSLLYSYYSFLLEQHYEAFLEINGISHCVSAFRRVPIERRPNDSGLNLGKAGKSNKCNIDFANDAFSAIKEMNGCYVLASDISGFFDNLDHGILKKNWSRLLGGSSLPPDHYHIYRSLTKYSFIERDVLFKSLGISVNNPKAISLDILNRIKRGEPIEFAPLYEKKFSPKRGYYLNKRTRLCSAKEFRDSLLKKGVIEVNRNQKAIPQGSSMSGMLSNIYMSEFDIAVNSLISKLNGRYFRYCDDILIVVPFSEDVPCIGDIETFIKKEIEKLKLELNPNKTERYSFTGESANSLNCRIYPSGESGRLQYLGYKFDGKNIHIRSSTMSRYKRKLRRGVKYSLRKQYKHDYSGALCLKRARQLYSHSGRSNFPTYLYRSSAILSSKAMRKQIASHLSEINNQALIIDKRIRKKKS
ncbi:reverse transcriptase domain-containing protein [Vibrio owensii]|uniref:reverse transcriptase domain-containing protein n=1 Tax=Vibrio owensii TaxID=696485 RepID=UPI003391E862